MDLSTLTDRELGERLWAVTQRRASLLEFIRASDELSTYAYYGRASREELPGTQEEIDALNAEMKRRWAVKG